MKKKTSAAVPSGKGWLPKVKKVAAVVEMAGYAVLQSGLKLPAKVVTGIKCLALLAGILKAAETPPKADE